MIVRLLYGYETREITLPDDASQQEVAARAKDLGAVAYEVVDDVEGHR